MNISDYLSRPLFWLQRFYARVAVARLHRLMEKYHKHAKNSEKSHTRDIKSSLLEYVDNVVVIEKNIADTETPHFDRTPVAVGDAVSRHVVKSHHNLYPFSFDKKQIGDLSRHFNVKKRRPELPPGVDEKLKNSIWSHINASVQCALRGDNRNAKLHVEIANYAFKELAHYMSEEKYLALSEKINRRLDTLKAA